MASSDAFPHVRQAMDGGRRFTRGGRRARGDVAATLSWLAELRPKNESLVGKDVVVAVKEETRGVEDTSIA
jgi:hypothetical protein